MTTRSDYQQAILFEMGITPWRSRQADDIKPGARGANDADKPAAAQAQQSAASPAVTSANAADRLAALKQSLNNSPAKTATPGGTSSAQPSANPGAPGKATDTAVPLVSLSHQAIPALVKAINQLGLAAEQYRWQQQRDIRVNEDLITSPPLDKVLEDPRQKRQLWEALKRVAATL